MKYDLYFHDKRIGEVSEKNSDFPNLWGKIEFDQSMDASSGQINRFKEFIELNMESSRLVDVEHEEDVKDELEKINQRLEDFTDYIETDGWFLVDNSGKKHYILVPIFHHSREIVWRWNPDK